MKKYIYTFSEQVKPYMTENKADKIVTLFPQSLIIFFVNFVAWNPDFTIHFIKYSCSLSSGRGWGVGAFTPSLTSTWFVYNELEMTIALSI